MNFTSSLACERKIVSEVTPDLAKPFHLVKGAVLGACSIACKYAVRVSRSVLEYSNKFKDYLWLLIN